MSEDYQAPSGAGHPITPPPELIRQWVTEIRREGTPAASDLHIATRAARWGADQELEACCEWLDDDDDRTTLHAHRRPKPPSLAEQAHAKLAAMESLWEAAGNEPSDIVRRALERLQELEGNG